MSDLLGIGSSALAAYRTALSAVGENVANARDARAMRAARVVLEQAQRHRRAPTSPIATQIMFNGVTAAGVARAWDDFRATEARFAASAAGRAAVREQWLTSVETALDDGAAGVGSSIDRLLQRRRRARRRPGRHARPRARC